MERVEKFLKEADTYYLATMAGGLCLPEGSRFHCPAAIPS